MDTPKSASSDIQEIRYRISQLEHLVVTNTLSSCSPGSSTLTQNSLIERISHLEGLLASSELENKTLCNEIQLLSVIKNRDEVEFTERIHSCNSEIDNLKYTIQLLELKYCKSNGKIENMKIYVDSLPSMEELDEATENITKLESENQNLMSESESLGNEITRLQVKLRKKDADYQKAVLRLKELEPLEEAQKEYLNKNWDDRVLDFSDEKSIIEVFTIQSAQIIRCGKIIHSLREKVTNAEAIKTDCEIKLADQSAEVRVLNQQHLASNMKIQKLLQKIKMQDEEVKVLHSECEKLRMELERKNNFLNRREEEMECLIKLSTEVDICMSDLCKLIELGESIAHGEEPSVETIIGIPDQLSFVPKDTKEGERNNALLNILTGHVHVAHQESSMSPYSANTGVGDGDLEWVLERLKSVSDMRKSIEKLRNKLIDLYTDILEGSADASNCNVQ